MSQQTMLAVIKAATGDDCQSVFKYEVEPGGWQLLLCNSSKSSYRLNESLKVEELRRIDGETGKIDIWKFIDKQWRLQ